LDPGVFYKLPKTFDFKGYIETEREFWALFPETEGKRVNFCQAGLTAKLYIDSTEAGSLGEHETYFLMPCPDGTMRPVRMRQFRRLTLPEYRMTHLTALKLIHKMKGVGAIMDDVHLQVLGPEILDELGY